MVIGGIICIIILYAVAFGISVLGIHVNGFLNKEKKNVERGVFVETQSYVQGKNQDLAKMFYEYNNTNDIQNKTVIKAMIRAQFADFNADNINNTKLRNFLVSSRGY